MLLAMALVGSLLRAQAPASTPAAPAFDAASVRQNRTGPGGDSPASNVPLGPGNAYTPTGGLFRVRNYTLLSYIAFAYRMTDGQLEAFRGMAPAWMIEDRFDVQARTDKADVSKDELRLMVRSLLAERFGMVVHVEIRQVPGYALELQKPGVLGPKLRLHPAAAPCTTDYAAPKVSSEEPAPAATPETVEGGFPHVCGSILSLPAFTPTHYAIGGRDVPVTLLANSLASWGGLGRPVVDTTGLRRNVDFALEIAPEPAVRSAGAVPGAGQDEGVSFREALKQQLGMRLVGDQGHVELLVQDRI